MKGLKWIMPRPRGSKNVSNKTNSPKIKVTSLTCTMCGKSHSPADHYQSFNPLHATGRVPYCKECLKLMCINSEGNIEVKRVYEMLKMIDRPFIYDLFKSSAEDKNDTIGTYMKNIAMSQFKYLGWKDSIFEPQIDNEEIIKNATVVEDEKTINTDNFIITGDIIDKWGYGFQKDEYLNFERKYKKLTKGYKEKTALHSERLDTYIIHKVKEEMATARGDVGEAEKWAKLAQKDAQDAKLNISQLSKSDITGGIDLLPQLVEAVEQYASLIPLLPKVLAQPYDDADLIIWANVNYLRHLEDKSFIPYRDIWNFYDKMLEEHYSQKGYNEQQIEEEKIKRNNIFRDLGEVYVEPLYENPDLTSDEIGDE